MSPIKAFGLALLIFALGVLPVMAAQNIPTDLSGTLSVSGRTATTVTVHAEQTSGDPVTVHVTNTCYAGSTFVGAEDETFIGSADLIFNTGPRKVKGKTLTPDHCYAGMYYAVSGNLQVGMAGNIDTLP